ncbi:MAG: peptidylprolyl isomerase [Desulfobacteraceae bacterium]|nr:peptidylprolyl isomerase [Desulfobacteraceae bacterium]
MLINRFKGLLVFAAAVFFLAGLIFNTGQAVGAEENREAENGKDYVAVVNGAKIPAQDLERVVDLVKARYGGTGAQIGGQQLAYIRNTILDNLIEQQLLYQASMDEGIKVDSVEVRQKIDKIKSEFESEDQFKNHIKGVNYTEEELEKEIRRGLSIRKLIEEKFGSSLEVTDQEVKSFYEDNKKQFEVPERVRASHILIRTDEENKAKAREKIREVKQKLEDGEDFSELAREYSDDPSGESGGDLGYFSRGQMVKNFEEAAFELQPGEVSDIVETRFGYHLIKLEDKKDKGVKPLAEVRDSIRKNLEQKKMMQKLEPYIESLKEKYPVEKNLPGADEG